MTPRLLKQVRRRRFLRLSVLWILFTATYFLLGVTFPSSWDSRISGNELSPLQTFAPFQSNETKSIVLLTYQRGGSTLFGNLFNSNPDIFYIFEPLDALYSDMYGTSRGWNVPSEITNYWNGSQRNLPPHEIMEVSLFLHRIFNCEMNQLPTSFFVHPYYFLYRTEYRLLDDYVTCIDSVRNSLTLCSDLKPEIEEFCGTRFGEQSEERLQGCYRMMWLGDFNIRQAPGKVRQAVFNYNKCIGGMRKQVDEACSPMMRNVCTDRQVRAVKCVRATMDSMEPLLRKQPNFRVIHLMRDPRGVVLSRMKFHDSTRNRYSDSGNDTMIREAELYCRTVVKDIEKRRELEKKYPGKIFSLLYDDFVTNIGAYTQRIYNFLDLGLPNSTVEWIREANRGKDGRNATTIANAWQETMTYREGTSIARNCREYFRLIKHVTTL